MGLSGWKLESYTLGALARKEDRTTAGCERLVLHFRNSLIQGRSGGAIAALAQRAGERICAYILIDC